ncbi:MAG TPA: hypothetical protein VGS41_00155 [Chthonomonadales bacterium]|nr:hypothetical protein [Chthonomonadales bacterium]
MADINLSAFLAARIRAAGKDLYNACKKMPEDRIGWHPETEGNKGRDALDQALECAYLNEWGAQAFRDLAIPAFDKADYKDRQDANRTAAAALAWLQRGTELLASAVASVPVGKLATVITNPFTKKETSLAEYADFFYWNTVYHEGQVNYIQVLYGDLD